MFKKEVILKLFLDFIESDYLDFDGIILKPLGFSDKNNHTIVFNISNPKKIPYYSGVIDELLNDKISEFSRYVGLKLKSYVNYDLHNPEIYFNEYLKNKIGDFFKSINVLHLTDSSKYDIAIKGKSLGYNVEIGEDRIIFWNEFVPKSGFVEDYISRKIITNDLNESINYYRTIIENQGSGYESDTVYRKLDTFWDDYPLLGAAWIAFYYHTGFID